jgi:hypothetical protein
MVLTNPFVPMVLPPETLLFSLSLYREIGTRHRIHNHTTCQRLYLHVEFWRISVFKKIIVNTGIKPCNKLPIQIRKTEKFSISGSC